MKIACIGGGPAGLYLGILVKRVAPQHEVVIYERNRPAETFGFGVVFSDATLGNFADADPETHAQITERFARWDDIEVHYRDSVMRSTGHGFCGLERKALLGILQARAAALGVRVEYERSVTSLADVGAADVVVACDGVGSFVRDALASELVPTVDVRPNKFVWLGCTLPYDAFTFLFEPTRFGLFRVHAYPYQAGGSTFIVECREETWRAAGLAMADEDQTVAILGEIFAAHLGPHRLVKNRSIWRSFPTVRCRAWHAGNVVLMGDAAHTAHFSIGSGTKLAMEDAIALRDALLAAPDVPAALATYEARRRPEVEALQAAAQASLEWFEGTERYLGMAPVQFMYSLMTRSLRVSHASMQRRDPALADGVEAILGGTPHATPFALAGSTLASRLVVEAHAADAAIPAHAGLVLASVVDAGLAGRAQAAGAALALRATPTAIPLLAARERGFAGLVLDPGETGDAAGLEALPAALAALGAQWPGWLGAVVHDQPGTRAAVVGHAAQLVRAGASLLVVESAADGRLPAASLADRLRNELHVATCIAARGARPTDLDAVIGAGRADLVIVEP